MHKTNDTRLDDNSKRVAVDALVTVANVSTGTREHYYISDEPTIPHGLHAHGPVTVISPSDRLARALIGKMKGEKIFYRHDLLIEFIDWPHGTRGRARTS
jgi:transcription elongation GreA/GreB family factor